MCNECILLSSCFYNIIIHEIIIINKHIKHKNTIPVIIISTIIDNRYTEDIYMNTNTNTSRRKIKKFLQQVVP